MISSFSFNWINLFLTFTLNQCGLMFTTSSEVSKCLGTSSSNNVQSGSSNSFIRQTNLPSLHCLISPSFRNISGYFSTIYFSGFFYRYFFYFSSAICMYISLLNYFVQAVFIFAFYSSVMWASSLFLYSYYFYCFLFSIYLSFICTKRSFYKEGKFWIALIRWDGVMFSPLQTQRVGTLAMINYLHPFQSSQGFPVRQSYLRQGSFPKHLALSQIQNTSIKLTVISNFLRLSHPQIFQILDMLLRARLRYSSYFSLFKFSIFQMMLFCRYRIFKCLQSTSKFSIFKIYCWCRETSQRVVRQPSLCYDLFLSSYYVILDILVFQTNLKIYHQE